MRSGATLILTSLLLTACAGEDLGDVTPLADGAVMDAAVQPDGSVPAEDLRPEIYPADRTQSPLTENVVTALQDIAAKAARADNAFSKIGDSITVSANFLACFNGGTVDLGGATALQTTIDHFNGGSAGGANPFSRTSLSATVGWKTSDALAGNPNAVAAELNAANPRFAVVMYGTNEIWQHNLDGYGGNLLTIIDTIIANGTIPVLSSIPPLARTAEEAVWTNRFNAVVRGIAQGRRIPFVDFYREISPLPGRGLGGDDVHPNVYTDGGAKACVLNATGLGFGYNVRNRVTLEALDRARQGVLTATALDATAPRMDGAGTHADPYVIPSLPFTHLGNTTGGERTLATYGGCAATQNEGGPERYYVIDVAADTSVRLFVLDRGGVDVDLHLLAANATAEACVARDDKEVGRVLTPGRWFISVDTFVDGAATEKAGEYLLVAIPE